MVSTAGAPHNSLTFANAELLREFCGNLKGAASFIPLGIDLPRRDLNRVSLSYFSPPVRAVSIPKKSGGERILGVPTVADRVAQMVVKQLIEPDLDPIFLPELGRSGSWAFDMGDRMRAKLKEINEEMRRRSIPPRFETSCAPSWVATLGRALPARRHRREHVLLLVEGVAQMKQGFSSLLDETRGSAQIGKSS